MVYVVRIISYRIHTSRLLCKKQLVEDLLVELYP